MVLRRALLLWLAAGIVGARAGYAAGPEAPALPAAGSGSPAIVPLGCPIVAPAALDPLPEGTDPESTVVTAGGAEFRLGGDGRFTRPLVIRQGDSRLSADDATYDGASGSFAVDGNIDFQSPEARVRGRAAAYSPGTEQLVITAADFELFTLPARGQAGRVAVEGSTRLVLEDVTYTACAPGKDDWLLRADAITIDRSKGMASARNARLDFMGVPILWVPYMTYPVSGQRKSGFLLPDFGSSGQRGVELLLPYYLNLAPNYDATLTPRYMSQRGIQMQGELRYLEENHRGTLGAEFLPDDKGTGDARSLLRVAHRSRLPGQLQLSLAATDVSDPQYFEDFASGIDATSQIALERRVDLQYFQGPWTMLLRLQDFQTLDEEGIVPEDRPYRRLPQLSGRGYWPRGPLGLEYAVNSDFTWFDRNVGVTGLRGHVLPQLALPLEWRGVTLRPAAALDVTSYRLDNTADDANDSPGRTVPIYTVDLSTVLERRVDDSRRYLQTLEPRIQYVHIPFEDQSDLPVFDTLNPDFNMVQLFRANRFVGLDRVGDTDQLSVGLTTRLIRASNGAQFLTATIGQTRYFTTRDVVLGSADPLSDSSSDYIGELGLNINDRWNVDLGYQWDSDASKTELAEIRVLYHPDDARILSVGYRLRGDNVEEVDVAAAWPLSDRWSAVGRYNYSLIGQSPLESFVGVEYATCCWGLRLTTRRNLVARTGESDTQFSLQLLLKGFGTGDRSARRVLGRDILDSNKFDRY
ncbi:MAG: LPS-assembly protein LptD [Chromatiales bacterium]|nr:LPS-assembly protein LptD [Chromatiales bacterium]